jgi:hypothetical protein
MTTINGDEGLSFLVYHWKEDNSLFSSHSSISFLSDYSLQIAYLNSNLEDACWKILNNIEKHELSKSEREMNQKNEKRISNAISINTIYL